MVIDVKQLFELENESRSVECELDLSAMELGPIRPFPQPVRLCGTLSNRAGIATLHYTAEVGYEGVCDRCLEPVKRQFPMTFSHTLVSRLEDESSDDLLLVEDGKLDFDELAQSDILLEFPTKILCGEDCKGLCPACGANRNTTDCGCGQTRSDPRLEALKGLL